MFMPSVFGTNFVDDVFDDFFGSSFVPAPHVTSPAGASMKADITETDKGYMIEMDLPGYSKKDVQAELKDGYMTITAEKNSQNEEKNTEGKVIRRERYQGVCRRSFYVGDAVTEKDIKAKFKDGVLTLEVPKKEKQPEVETKKFIAIEG
ncbi:MAG: Hsp20/alpha crystallin family protein [Eubacterium sp.]|nr:Hsp20/alpha crystallin family protein [Eubacterium sp.]